MELCIRCKGRGFCGKPCAILSRLRAFQPKIETEFSGSSPPEIFVGKYGYPNVFTGILAPAEHGETEKLSMPEAWHSENASIEDILSYRSRLIYSRFAASIRSPKIYSEKQNRFLDTMQQVSLASKAVDLSFKLKKKPEAKFSLDGKMPMIGNPAPLESARIDSNPIVEKKVDYLANDADAKANDSINELYGARIPVSNIIKILSAGMLGLRHQRKLVPTRWAVTATDDAISKKLLKKIKYHQQISRCLLFSSNYLGNYYNILLIPGAWSFEVIEASAKGYFGKGSTATWHDHELFSGRKDYADSVTGAYYANRLAVCEYLESIKRQASVLVMREIREEYWAPCGVGILREATRDAFKKKPEEFDSEAEALNAIGKKFMLPVKIFSEKSKILNNKKTQMTLKKFL